MPDQCAKQHALYWCSRSFYLGGESSGLGTASPHERSADAPQQTLQLAGKQEILLGITKCADRIHSRPEGHFDTTCLIRLVFLTADM